MNSPYILLFMGCLLSKRTYDKIIRDETEISYSKQLELFRILKKFVPNIVANKNYAFTPDNRIILDLQYGTFSVDGKTIKYNDFEDMLTKLSESVKYCYLFNS